MPRDMHPDSNEPWQRNPWVWLVIAIPSLTVAGCLVTAYLAVSRPDYLVGDYPYERTATEQPSGETVP
jgi:hypothetical protein